eukprot:CAMPEP_0115182048 /NCGR_PEP_ID=MMETSP0270-20121206/7744_1 /TAXON_ID=71861 /ORGANISM="Scrippsiella trochoidea, Strain CCMP3099" /LENGTH=236 /DNA_ID=CAMNT_0002595087 /DNA_START=909 /DNA_END=1619 /DNA_ORIENTATION=-
MYKAHSMEVRKAVKELGHPPQHRRGSVDEFATSAWTRHEVGKPESVQILHDNVQPARLQNALVEPQQVEMQRQALEVVVTPDAEPVVLFEGIPGGFDGVHVAVNRMPHPVRDSTPTLSKGWTVHYELRGRLMRRDMQGRGGGDNGSRHPRYFHGPRHRVLPTSNTQAKALSADAVCRCIDPCVRMLVNVNSCQRKRHAGNVIEGSLESHINRTIHTTLDGITSCADLHRADLQNCR